MDDEERLFQVCKCVVASIYCVGIGSLCGCLVFGVRCLDLDELLMAGEGNIEL